MPDQRQNLLHLLQEAYALALDVERAPRRLGGPQYASRVPFVNPMEISVKETLGQQRLLIERLRRIDGGGETVRAINEDLPIGDQHALASEPDGDAPGEMAHVHALTLQEIDVYSACIATAESNGFFETRFICEAILLQKSAMAACLSRDNPPTAQT
ncbi:hypothetical protein [Paraburkholderia humisilvae]|uniref:Uncharacterized protein n=2 Tax=Paraburkholderia humisilvae TaxID=627669 RepID=A0A6J5F6I3_9BURK|nr:hypothetical protein LMG29542_07213 [Paraburkholderia humisilvae]